VQEGRIVLGQSVHVEAEGFMATVHGAMLSARAYGDPTMFSLVVDPLLLRLKA
jgi:TetR/AcrR family transcriptional repressor of nem operon